MSASQIPAMETVSIAPRRYVSDIVLGAAARRILRGDLPPAEIRSCCADSRHGTRNQCWHEAARLLLAQGLRAPDGASRNHNGHLL
jgi:hypothetical protein